MRATDHEEARLIAVWRRRRRNAWPETFAEAMADPIYSRVILLEADRELREAQARRQSLESKLKAAPLLDNKRRAAGENDED